VRTWLERGKNERRPAAAYQPSRSTREASGVGGVVIGVDLGGTKIGAGVVTAKGTVRRHRSTPTPLSGAGAIVAAIAAIVEEVAAGEHIKTVGVASAGIIDPERRQVIFAPNLPLRRTPLAGLLSRMLGVPVVLENDANAAAWAESRFGGRDLGSLVMLTIGTGIGGGVVIDGRLLRGLNGMSGEVGHLWVADHGYACECGGTGCLEAVASGTALLREVRRLVAANPPRAEVLTRLAGHDLEGLTGAHITTAGLKGDGVALDAFEIIGAWLGRAIASIVAVLDVEAVVLGGGVSAAGDLLRDPTQKSMSANLFAAEMRQVPDVLLAALGPTAGIIGAADLARCAVTSTPQ